MKNRKKRTRKKVPPVNRTELSSAVADFLAKGGKITRIITDDVADPNKQHDPEFNEFNPTEAYYQ